MARLDDLVRWMNEELNLSEVPDYSGAMNGLQLANSGEVNKVATAVDASLPVFEKAVAAGADLLIVHHGMFWQGAQMLTGANYKKIKLAMDNDMAVYSAHIPLDVHPLFGNNACLAREIGMSDAQPYFPWKGIQLGLKQNMEISRDELRARLEKAVGGPVHVCPAGPEKVGMVGLITGGAGSEVQAMADAGIQTYITGEGQHWTYPLAEELGVNLFYAGHYATETFGVNALSEVLSGKFKLAKEAIIHPTGL
ncbi:Nif3-like dinuclear metal center hexameric protein [Persicirhabdus sediminis]|uniref:GTP cyclohydrolase 1 type 2 homolog n=1 Tax=Persicirhabdus sediminis TaxID=454144 RepID=A0A8J7MD62_9BACT|nr:Nif3-like dinuclear metal center hexameric protein [Persicirhabdus sediminis]MBK1790426.1 Nif3-like dinuclear metal center hexameric protein [Persicirhabdus sediminis]